MVLVNTLQELENFADQFSKTLKPADVILLEGNLGAGKTTFVQYLCKYLGIKDRVNSPTFSLLNIYDDNVKVPFYHFDLYRLENELELEEIGFFEAINSNNIVCIEWALKFPAALPDNATLLQFEQDNENRFIKKSIWSNKY